MYVQRVRFLEPGRGSVLADTLEEMMVISRPLSVAAALFLPAIALAQMPPPAPGMPLTGPALLNKVLADVRAAYNKQERPMVIFDIDGTLLDNRSRQRQILVEFAQELKAARPAEAARIGAVTVEQIQYRLTDTLAAIGITDQIIVNNAAATWGEKFYDENYLKYDQPTPGAVNFVRTLYSNGARIVYLSGRDAPRQLIGSVKSLRDLGYPIGIQGTELIMKPTMQTQDAIFKQQVTNYLRHYGKVIATFDNEPANANVYRRAFNDSSVILYTAPHSPNPPPLLPNILPLPSFEGPLN
jgi:hypothetical protein